MLTIERNGQKIDYGNKKAEKIIPSWIVAEVDNLNSVILINSNRFIPIDLNMFDCLRVT